jgi:hypothetical protein
VNPREIDPCWKRVIGDPGDGPLGFAPLRERYEALQPNMRDHLCMAFEMLDQIEALKGLDRPLCTRQALNFGFALKIPDEERDQVATCLYGWRYTEKEESFMPILESFLVERVRASHMTMNYGLIATVQSLAVGAALLRFLATGIAGEASSVVKVEHVLAAMEEVDRIFFHKPLILERFADSAAPVCKEVRYAEILMALPKAPPQVDLDYRPGAMALSQADGGAGQTQTGQTGQTGAMIGAVAEAIAGATPSTRAAAGPFAGPVTQLEPDEDDDAGHQRRSGDDAGEVPWAADSGNHLIYSVDGRVDPLG